MSLITTTRRLLQSVTPLRETADEQVIPNGEVWEIEEWWGVANPSTDTSVALIWDYEGDNEELIAITHSEQSRKIYRQLTGDGTKKIALVLRNFTLNSESLGAGFTYKVL